MSFLSLIEEQKLVNVLDLLAKYEQRVEEGDGLFNLEGRRIEEICRTLPHNQQKFEQYYQEMKSLEEWVVNLKDRIYAKYWKKYTEGYARALGPNDIKAYVNGEKEIIEMNQIIIEVQLVKQRLQALVKGFEQMGWMLGHITKLRVAELEQAIL
jgi:hypothetical protein